MATPVYIDGWLECVLRASQEGSERVNVLNYLTTGTGWTSAQLAAFGQGLWGSIGTAYRNLASSTVSFLEVQVTDRSNALGLQGTYTIPGSPTGVATGVPLPANVAGAIQWKTGRPGKSYRGRTETFGLVDGQAVGSVFTSAAITLLTTLASNALSYHTAGPITADLAVVSRKHALATIVASALVDAFTDSMRSRLVGRGA